MTFKSYEAYLKALASDPKLAILTINGAATALDRSPQTIKNWIKSQRIGVISIGDDYFPRAKDIYKKIRNRKKEAIKVKKRLVILLKNNQKNVYYGDLMEEFGYNYRNSGHRDSFGWVLGAASRLSFGEMENELGSGEGAFISSMVWRKDTDFVSEAYWGLVRDVMGKVPSDDECENFVTNHIEKCSIFYAESS